MLIKYVVSSFFISVTRFEKQNNKKYNGKNLYMILIKWTQIAIKKIELKKIFFHYKFVKKKKKKKNPSHERV